MEENKRVVVIGGGAAGMIAAATAANRGLDVYLVEKTEVWKEDAHNRWGRCNITNNTDIEGMVRSIPINGRFLYSAFNAFSNWDIVNLLEN